MARVRKPPRPPPPSPRWPVPEIDRGRRRLLMGAAALPVAFAAGARAGAPARARGAAVRDVRRYGARGDGEHDDTAAFQRAIDALPAEGGTVRVPAGTYLIDPLRSVRLRSRMHLRLDPAARLLAKPNAAPRAYVLNAHGVSDVEISGGRIVGDRDRHLGTRGEWGHGIMVRGCRRVTVRDIHISRCWGDGMSIGAIDAGRGRPVVRSEDVVVARVTATGNRRQGLTIGRARRVRVFDCEFSHTGGTPPAAGIDVEPDSGADTGDVVIERCRVFGNRGPGIQLWRRVSEVAIRDCDIHDNRGHGILVAGASRVDIIGNRLRANTPRAIGLRDRTAAVTIAANRFAEASPAPRHAARATDRHIRIADGVARVRIADNRYD